MPKRITGNQREAVLTMLAHGHDRDTIAAMVGVTPGQVSAILAHVSMGTYRLPRPEEAPHPAGSCPSQPEGGAIGHQESRHTASRPTPKFPPVPLGSDVETNEPVYWNPDPDTGSANPHVLILGESGFGKTYTVCCLLAELAERGTHSIVFDYGQGFAKDSAPEDSSSGLSP